MRIDNGNNNAASSSGTRFDVIAKREARQAAQQERIEARATARQERLEARAARREDAPAQPSAGPTFPVEPDGGIGDGAGPIPFPENPIGPIPSNKTPIDPGFGGGTIFPPEIRTRAPAPETPSGGSEQNQSPVTTRVPFSANFPPQQVPFDFGLGGGSTLPFEFPKRPGSD